MRWLKVGQTIPYLRFCSLREIYDKIDIGVVIVVGAARDGLELVSHANIF